MNDEFTIRLEIADKYYRLRCKRSEEQIMRKAAKQVNELVNQYRGEFPGPDLELKDILAMVAFHLSSQNLKKDKIADVSPVFGKLEDLSFELDSYLLSERE